MSTSREGWGAYRTGRDVPGATQEGADHDPSGNLATIKPLPPAPPSGAIPDRIEV